ncbi:MAG: flagellar biosynthetic protein FliO [Methylophilaceae bacterium]
MLLALGLVLALIMGMAWLLRRLAPGQVGNAGGLRVVSAVAVGAKERVVLVDVGNTRLVLGVAAGQVTCLHQMPRPEDSGTIPHETAIQPFVDKLREMISARKEPK